MNYDRELLNKVLSIVRNYNSVAESRVLQEWSRYSEPEGDSEIHSSAKELTSSVSALIWAYGQKAWILEYGSGSEMVTSTKENPFLAEYMRSEGFNKERFKNALAITGREQGYYTDLDGVTHYSTGTMQGKNLEQWRSTKSYTPISPKKIIYHVLFGSGEDGLISEMQREIQMALQSVLIKGMRLPKEIRLK